MQILVTGGAGCIGSDLAGALLAQGHRVRVYDNLSSGKSEHVAPLMSKPGFELVEADLLDEQKLDAAMSGVEFVHHLAANPDVKFTPGDPTDKDLKQNTLATYYLLEAMRRHGVRQLAFSSTSAVYGISEVQPIPEGQTCRPISLYGATKLSCEALIGAFQHLFDMQCWVFRFANIVGPKVRKKGRTVIGDFIARLQENPRELLILGNGKQAKSYLLSEECVAAMLFTIEHATAPYNVFNLGCADSTSVNDIADMVVQAMGLSGVTYKYTGTEGGWLGDVPRFTLDVAAINRLGWHAQHTSREAVTQAIGSTLAQMAGQAVNIACKP